MLPLERHCNPAPKTFLTDGFNRAHQGSSSGEKFSVEELRPRVKLHE